MVITTDQMGFDYGAILKKARLIVDTRNALKGVVSGKIVRLQGRIPVNLVPGVGLEPTLRLREKGF